MIGPQCFNAAAIAILIALTIVPSALAEDNAAGSGPLLTPPALSPPAPNSSASMPLPPATALTDAGRRLILPALELMRANHNADAAVQLKRATELFPGLAEAHHNLGLALAKLGDTQKAISELTLSTQLKPDLTESWLTLAGLEQSAGQLSQAMAAYSEYLKRTVNRADLAETRSKARKLLESLQPESHQVDAVTDHADVQASQSAEANLPAKAQADLLDDYLNESTHAGTYRWSPAGMPIRVCIHDASAVPGFKPRFMEILLQSFADWSSASQGAVTFQFVASGQAHDLDCQFVAQGAYLHNPAEAGEAAMVIGEAGKIQKGTISLLTQATSQNVPLTDNRMRLTCLHEIGHALGLAGHTANPEDIMFYLPSLKDEWRNLSSRDIRTIKRLYASN